MKSQDNLLKLAFALTVTVWAAAFCSALPFFARDPDAASASVPDRSVAAARGHAGRPVGAGWRDAPAAEKPFAPAKFRTAIIVAGPQP